MEIVINVGERVQMLEKEENKGEIIIYKADSGPELAVKVEDENIWLTQADISSLYQTDRTSIGRHIRNIVKSGELEEKSNVQNLHIANADRPVKYYNLDFVLSVGYRVNSKRATQFRIWATQRLRDFLLKGYLINEKRLQENQQLKFKEFQQDVSFMQHALEVKRLEGYEKELLHIFTDYTNTWITLNQFDKGDLTLDQVTKKGVKHLDYDQVKKSIERFKARLIKDEQASELFGAEVGKKLAQVLGSIGQTYNGKDLYPSLDEKAAHILYFAVKDHPFVDGNKRIGALLFLLFLINNNYLINRKGEKKINDTALTVLTLLVAASKPDQKNVMIRLIVNLINKN